ncbi:hypothetical protein OIE66_42345 [Nonomuraea sp. NBC_01738]|uniref:hypothetical protein n=1 Tax=Nonomuraea sp. NBC_01738 TaxID=2976003 RepID=UPI002E132C84|nr:hypothetical protein OIE66_42345 [Nonomuraea sp. NBC_01738]
MGFGVREFELALMHRMRDLNPERVEDALTDMDVTRADLRSAHAHWTRILHVRPGMGALRTALGAPRERTTRPVGSLTCTMARWPLPAWPELVYEALLGPGGELWHQWLVRPAGELTVSFDGLLPWSCVVADVGTSFPRSTQQEGSAPHHWVVDFTHGGADYRARFVYGLLQRVDTVQR